MGARLPGISSTTKALREEDDLDVDGGAKAAAEPERARRVVANFMLLVCCWKMGEELIL